MLDGVPVGQRQGEARVSARIAEPVPSICGVFALSCHDIRLVYARSRAPGAIARTCARYRAGESYIRPTSFHETGFFSHAVTIPGFCTSGEDRVPNLGVIAGAMRAHYPRFSHGFRSRRHYPRRFNLETVSLEFLYKEGL